MKDTFIWLTSDEWTAAASVALVVVTAFLARYTWRLFQTTQESLLFAQASLEIARQSADALPKIERAYVVPEMKLGNGMGPLIINGRRIDVDMSLKNLGRTPATLTLLRAVGIVAATPPQELPPNPIAENPVPEGIYIAQGGDWHYTLTKVVTEEEFNRINAGDLFFYCVGKIGYRDVLSAQRETGFCFAVADFDGTRVFTPVAGTPLNFAR